MDNWKELFRTHILKRGLNYYEMGAVKSIEQEGNGYTAVVTGSEDYEVEIEIRDGEINDMWCSCPYAEGGNYCKHMAAVLYELEEEGDEIKSDDKTWVEQIVESKRKLKEVIERVPEDEIRNLLSELAQENEALKNHILTKYSANIDKSQMVRLKDEIDNIACRYSDRSGFVDWRNAGEYISAMEIFLHQNVQALIDRTYYMQAFELTNDVFVKIGNQDMDDSDGGTTMVANTCYELWKQILEKCEEPDKKKMFLWFEKHQADGIVIDYMEDYIQDFLMSEFHSKELLEQKLHMLDEMIKRAEEKTDSGKSWSTHYGCENNILKRLEIMGELDYSKEEIRKYIEKNWRFSAVRKLEIEECLKQGNIARAICILKESKKLDKDYPGLVAQYSAKLIDLYCSEKMDREYKEELIFQIFSCRQDNLDFVNRLKLICKPPEWDTYREKILSEKTGWQIKYPLMEEEAMYERLLKTITAEGSIYLLDRYEKTLKKIFPEQVKDAYVTYVKKQTSVVSDRKGYKELIEYLKKIRCYPAGKETAAKLAEEWRACYCRRTAMMDELRKAGF